MAEYVCAVDLGKWVSGLAVFRDAELVWAAEVVIRRDTSALPDTARRMAWALAARAQTVSPFTLGGRWVAERMRDYKGKHARKLDLAHLKLVSKRLRNLLRPTPLYLHTAWDWKRHISKELTRRRVRRILTETEYRRIPPKEWESKEVIDAIGIGLFEVERAGPGMVPL